MEVSLLINGSMTGSGYLFAISEFYSRAVSMLSNNYTARWEVNRY